MIKAHEINEYEDLDDHDKSLLLARAMGLGVQRVVTNPFYALDGVEPRYCEVIFYMTQQGYSTETTDFYDDHLEVAWMVLNWAWDKKAPDGSRWSWILDEECLDGRFRADDFQRRMLDMVLKLCLRDGIIEPEQVVGTLTKAAHALGYRSEEE